MKQHLTLTGFVIAAVAAAFTFGMLSSQPAEAGNYGEKAEAKNIVETAVGAGQFDTLVAAVKAAGLVETLSGEGPFTVFAPTDAAFAALPEGAVDALLADKAKLTSVLTHHVVPGKLMASDVLGSETLTSAFGQPLPISAASGAAIAGASISTTDILCSNGVIHVIDSVIMPKNLVEVAVSNEEFSTLVAAVKAAGLADTLSAEGPFTIFAPNDAAFAKVPEETLAELLKPENQEQLQAVLTYHVVPGKITAEEVAKLQTAKTAQGSELSIDIKKSDSGEVEAVMVDGAKVLATDVIATNGIIHIIDSVVLPKS